MKLTLETERLILRPFREDDAEDMFNGWTSDDEVTKYITWNTHENIDTTKYILNLWISEYEKPERLNFSIELKDGNKLIGGIDVVGYDKGVPVIGYNLSRKYWNHGYMTEACKCLLEYLFSKGFEEVKIDAVVENVGSNRVIQKCGGVLVKTEEEFFPLRNKAYIVNRYIVKCGNMYLKNFFLYT